MLISIVTAVHNRAATIGATLATVRAQKRGTGMDVEHIVQDGGSTDGTLEILRAAERTARGGAMRLVSAPDAGLYDALNRGLARTTGAVIGLVHSDDVLAANDILACVARAFADPAVDAVYGDLDYVSARDPERVVRRWRSGPFTPALLARGWMPPHPTLFLRRRVLEQLGAYNASFRIAADYDAVLRYFSSPGFRAVHLPRVFVRMRTGGASNASLGQILQKSREDYRALRRNRITGALGPFTPLAALVGKNLGKISQFALDERQDPGRDGGQELGHGLARGPANQAARARGSGSRGSGSRGSGSRGSRLLGSGSRGGLAHAPPPAPPPARLSLPQARRPTSSARPGPAATPLPETP